MRMAVEPYLTQMAASQVGRADIIEMTRQFEIMSNTTDLVEWLEANASFHAAIYHRANRPMTAAHVDQLRKLTDRYLYLHLAVIGNVEHLQEEHTAIWMPPKPVTASGSTNLPALISRHHTSSSSDTSWPKMIARRTPL